MAQSGRIFRLVMSDDGVVRLTPALRPSTPQPRRYYTSELDSAPVQDQIHAVFPDLGPGQIGSEALRIRARWALRWAIGVAFHRGILTTADFGPGWYDAVAQRCYPEICGRVADELYASVPVINTDALLEQQSEWVDGFGPADDTLFATVGWARWAEFTVAQEEAAVSSFAQPVRYRSYEDFADSDARVLLADTGEVVNLMTLYGESSWDIAAMWHGTPTSKDFDRLDRVEERNAALSRGVKGAARGIASVARGTGAVVGFFVDVADQRAAREEREALNDLRRARTRNYNRRNSRW